MAERASTKHDIQHDEVNITRPNYSAISRVFVTGSIGMVSTGVDSGTGDVTLFVTGTPSILDSGWNIESHTWECISTDNPIFNVSINANVTGTIGNGNRVWVTQSGANKFFLVHGVGITGSTTYLNLYGGTDYSIVAGALGSPQYSRVKAPFGFPVDPDKWTVQVEDTTLRQQASPTANVWYNNGSISINIPIGKWFASYEAEVQSEKLPPTGTFISNYCTLSTANNSETDKKWTTVLYRVDGNTAGLQVFGPVTRSNEIVALVKTTYYLNQKTDQPLTANIYFRGDLSTIVLRARSGYL